VIHVADNFIEAILQTGVSGDYITVFILRADRSPCLETVLLTEIYVSIYIRLYVDIEDNNETELQADCRF
jgi:hypothetical protein